MNIDLKLTETTPLQVIRDLIGRHGRLTVLWVVLRAVLNNPKGQVPLPHLDNHLRQDIGLEPLPPDATPGHIRHNDSLFPQVRVGGLDVWRL